MHFSEQRSCAWWLLWAAAREPRAGPGDGVAPKLHNSLSTSPRHHPGRNHRLHSIRARREQPKKHSAATRVHLSPFGAARDPWISSPPRSGEPCSGGAANVPKQTRQRGKEKASKGHAGEGSKFPLGWAARGSVVHQQRLPLPVTLKGVAKKNPFSSPRMESKKKKRKRHLQP